MSEELILVTGGAGFIGSHTVGSLLKQGHRVLVLDNLSTGKLDNLEPYQEFLGSRLFFQEVDIIEGLWPTLARCSKLYGQIHRIIHLAAQTSVVVSIDNPIEDIRCNYTTTMQLVEYAKTFGVRKIVFASSAAVYGDVEEVPVAESAPTRPLSPYGIHKLSSESVLRYASDVHGIPTTALRFFNVYGPRQDPKSPYSGVISIFIDRAVKGQALAIFGDGTQTRDFVFVQDVAQAIVTACFSESESFAAYNIGTGLSVTIQELAEVIIQGCGDSSSLSWKEPRAGEILHSCAQVQKIQAELGFSARISLREGLSSTIEWYRKSH